MPSMKYNSSVKSMKTPKEVNFDVNDFWKEKNSAMDLKHQAISKKNNQTRYDTKTFNKKVVTPKATSSHKNERKPSISSQAKMSRASSHKDTKPYV